MAIGKIKRPITGDLPSSTQEFIANSEITNPFELGSLKELTLDDLVIRYKEIDQQSQLFKGQILLEARERFQSNIEFGNWLSVNFTERNSSNTGKLINLAKFFQGERSLTGIPLSAGYLISAPSNKAIATQVYSDIKDKGFKLDEIKKIISTYKAGTQNPSNSNNTPPKVTHSNAEVTDAASDLLDRFFEGKSTAFKIDVLKQALLYLRQ